MSSDTTAPILTEKTPVKLTVRKLAALITSVVVLTAGAVGYHLNLIGNISRSLTAISTDVRTSNAALEAQIKALADEMAHERALQKQANWSVTDQIRWGNKLREMNEPVKRDDSKTGLAIPDPYEIHPLGASTPVASASPQ